MQVLNQDPPTIFNESEIDFYMLAVYSGVITTRSLSLEYHYKIARHLEQGLHLGFGDVDNLKRYEIMDGLRKHIFVFSAAKQYSQVREMSSFIVERGTESGFKQFKDLANQVFEAYNTNYLNAEYSTAIGQAEMASQWADFEETKETFPFLRYHTQGDDRVRDEHAALNGITRPVDDKFWNNYMPKNGWRCRCFVTKHHTADVTNMDNVAVPEFGEKGFPKIFRMNPGKDRIIFNPKFHPYFRVARGDSEWKEQNFGLPTS